MKRKSKKNRAPLAIGAAVGAAALLGGAIVVSKQIKKARQRMAQSYKRWHPITVNRESGDITMNMNEMKELADLSDSIEVRINPVPGGRGTEIAARLTDSESPQARTMLRKMRAALRNTQWLLETGEILSPDKPSTTRQTLTSIPLQFAIRRGRDGGRL